MNLNKYDTLFSRKKRLWIALAIILIQILYYSKTSIPVEVYYSVLGIFILYLLSLFIYYEILLHNVNKSDPLYIEHFASGHSHLNLFTKFGNAQNCLRIILTKEYLVISSWFPFSLLIPFFDCVHIIPVSNLVSIKSKKRFLGGYEYQVSFKDDDFEKVSIFSIVPKKRDKFEAAFKDIYTH